MILTPFGFSDLENAHAISVLRPNKRRSFRTPRHIDVNALVGKAWRGVHSTTILQHPLGGGPGQSETTGAWGPPSGPPGESSRSARVQIG